MAQDSNVMNKRLFYVSFLIISCIIIFSQCVRKAPQTDSADIRGKQFAGAAACMSCHRQIYDAYMHTGHFNTSSPASTKTIKGSFGTGANGFLYSNGVRVIMERRDSGLFQTAYADSTLQEIHRFDITMGSGRKAQTFLTWNAGKYFQLPLSWFVPANSWANSPGFPPSYPKFDRMIPSTCFGCHSSAVGIKDVHMEGRHLSETFEKNQLVYGIDCERCHGPAAEHVAFHTGHPQEKIPCILQRCVPYSTSSGWICVLCAIPALERRKNPLLTINRETPCPTISFLILPALHGPPNWMCMENNISCSLPVSVL
ncbi:hypothetical protein FEF09_04875 [Chitinophaga pinensis]|uniref:Cytochrome c-552/4 domain-containing protein n=1 Tax=Chitinophaga pinensis TaxID=79329 RepID=A0A5C6LZ91_9BACT|nr:hypothetical protein FEF09_04875 [Chitinophaga pinensis]